MIIFITNKPYNANSVRTVIHQLLEQGIPFYGWREQKLPDQIPDNLEDFEAAIISENILRQADATLRQRLEKYAASKYLSIVPERYDSLDIFHCRVLLEVDMNMFASEAGLKPRKIEPLDDETIIKGCIERICEFWAEPFSRLNEYHLHCMEGALAVENTPFAPADWSRKTDNAFRQIIDMLSPDGDHDQLAGASLAEMYFQRTGDDSVRKKLLEVIDKVIAVRPRTPEGLLAMGGNLQDPLFYSGENTPHFGCNSYTILGRDLVTNEMFHFYGGVFAAAAAAGRPEMLSEGMNFLSHLERFHRDPADGLLFHASRGGMPIGEKWGRGNTHALLGAFYMLRRCSCLPEDYKRQIVDFLDLTGRGLIAVQHPSGFFHNVLNNPASSLETSCTILITYIYSWCINQRLLPLEPYLPMLQKSQDALRRKFWHGFGSGNCIGTFPALDNPAFYLRRSMHEYTMPLAIPALLESGQVLKNRKKH